MNNAIMIAFSAPISIEDDAAFNRWYDEVHLPEVASFRGVVSARRYKAADIDILPGMTGPSHPYIAIYELAAIDEADLQIFMNAMVEAINCGHFTMTGPIDMLNAGATLALPIGKAIPA